jgi:hypothetical protein
MKVIILLVLMMSSTICQEDWNLEARDFLTSYLSVIEDKQETLDVDCLSGQFVTLINEINKAVHDEDYTTLISKTIELLQLEQSKCPVDDLKMIFNDYYRAYTSGVIVRNIFSNMSSIEDDVRAYIIKDDRDMKDLGTLIGGLTKIAIYGTHTHFEFLK